MPPPLLPGVPLLAQFPCLFGGAERAKGYPAFLLAAGSSRLHDLTRCNEKMDRKVNKTCPELDGKWRLQDSDRGLVRSMHDSELLPFRSEQTSFLSESWGFPPLQLVLMSFFPPCALLPTEAVTASHLEPPAAWHDALTSGGLASCWLDRH